MSYHITKISPSALAATERCPGFRPDGEDSQASIDGTMFHDLMEEMVATVPRQQWRGWVTTKQASPQLMGLVEMATEAILTVVVEDLPVFRNFRLRMRGGKPRKTPLKPGLYPELELERGQGRHGYIDLLVVTPEGLVYVIDYKSNRVGKDFSWQLGAYCVDVNNLCTAHTGFVCMIVAPRLGDEEQLRMEIGPKELQLLRERINRIETRADEFGTNDAIVGCPGEQCEHCHRKGKCKWQAGAVATIAEAARTDVTVVTKKTNKTTVVPCLANLIGPGGPYEGEVFTNRTLIDPETPRQRGLRRAIVKFTEVLLGQVKKDDQSWAKQYTGEQLKDLVPGFTVSWRGGQGSFDETKESEVRSKVMSEFGLTIEDVFDVSVIDKDKLVELLHATHGLTKKLAEERVKKLYEPYTTPGAPVLYWTPKPVSKQSAIDVEFVDAK